MKHNPSTLYRINEYSTLFNSHMGWALGHKVTSWPQDTPNNLIYYNFILTFPICLFRNIFFILGLIPIWPLAKKKQLIFLLQNPSLLKKLRSLQRPCPNPNHRHFKFEKVFPKILFDKFCLPYNNKNIAKQAGAGVGGGWVGGCIM